MSYCNQEIVLLYFRLIKNRNRRLVKTKYKPLFYVACFTVVYWHEFIEYISIYAYSSKNKYVSAKQLSGVLSTKNPPGRFLSGL